MSFEILINNSIKDVTQELKKEKNMNYIKYELLNPLIEPRWFDLSYPWVHPPKPTGVRVPVPSPLQRAGVRPQTTLKANVLTDAPNQPPRVFPD